MKTKNKLTLPDAASLIAFSGFFTKVRAQVEIFLRAILGNVFIGGKSLKDPPKLRPIPLSLSLIIFSGFSSGINAEDVRLLGYWNFDNPKEITNKIVVDSVNGIKGTVKGNIKSVKGAHGKEGDHAIDLGPSPAGKWVRIEHPSWLKPASKHNQITVVLWQKLHKVTSSSTFWLGAKSATAGQRNAQAHLPWSNGTIYWDTAGCCGGGTQRISKKWKGDYTKWNHYAFVKDGSQKAIYINGKLFHAGRNTHPLRGDWTVASIGSNNSGGSNVAGVVDDFAVFGSALSQSHIKSLAKREKRPDQLQPTTATGGDYHPDTGITLKDLINGNETLFSVIESHGKLKIINLQNPTLFFGNEFTLYQFSDESTITIEDPKSTGFSLNEKLPIKEYEFLLEYEKQRFVDLGGNAPGEFEGPKIKENDGIQYVAYFGKIPGMTPPSSDAGILNPVVQTVGGFQVSGSKMIIDPTLKKAFYVIVVNIPYIDYNKLRKKKNPSLKRKGHYLEDGKFVLEQNLQWMSGTDADFAFSGAKVSLPDIPLGKGRIEGVVLDISGAGDVDTWKFNLKGGLALNKHAKAWLADKEFTVEIEVSNNGLEKIKGTGARLAYPLGHGFFLQDVGVEIGGLTSDASNSWYFNVNGLSSWGSKKLSLFGGDYYFVSIDGRFAMNHTLSFETKGTGRLMGVPVGAITVGFSSTEPSSRVQARINILNIIIGDMRAGLKPIKKRGQVSGMSLYANASAKLKVPKGVPLVGGMGVGSVAVGAKLDHDFDWASSNERDIAKAGRTGVTLTGEIPINITPEIPKKCWSKCWKWKWPHLHCKWSGCKWHKHKKKSCVKVCSPRIPAVKGTAGFRFSSNKSPAFHAWLAGATRNYYQAAYPWERPLVYDYHVPDTDAVLTFNTNWDILWADTKRGGIIKQSPIGKAGPEEIVEINVPEELGTAIFRLNYESENVDQLDLGLITPDGTALNLADGPFPLGFTAQGITGAAAFNPGSQEAFFMIHDVKPGLYKMVIDNPAVLGGRRVELASMTGAPIAMAVVDNQAAKGGEILPGAYQIDWVALDEDSPNAEVNFYIDMNNEGNDGILVGGGMLSELNPDEPFKFDTDHLEGIRPGYYYGVVAVDDGRNPPVYSYSDAPIWIDMDNAPKPVTRLSSRGGNNKVILEWDRAEGWDKDAFSYYNIHLSTLDHFDGIVKTVDVRTDKNFAVVDGLENGQPYLVSVTTVDEEDRESGMMEIHRVTPTKMPGSTPHKIISDPITTATAGYNYAYVPRVFDADTHDPRVRTVMKFAEEDLEAGESIKFSYKWSIIEGPEGMTIDENVGVVQWMPTEGQEGEHKVTIAATEEEKSEGIVGVLQTNTATQSFDLLVYPKWNISGIDDSLRFVNEPPLTAVAGEQYLYKPEISTDDEVEIELVSGPHGVEVNDAGEVVWNVGPEDNGGFVHLRAYETASGETADKRFFLHVSSDANNLKIGAELTHIQPLEDKVLLGWVGDSLKYQLQATEMLKSDNSSWKDVGEPIEDAVINYLPIEGNNDHGSMYYRIKVVE